MRTVKAAVCRTFGAPLTIEDIELAAPGPNQVEVTLAACAICYSDISMIDGGWGGHLPAVYGHEASGHITGVGPGVAGFAEGDAVLVTLIRACGTCPACVTAHPATCVNPGPRDNGILRSGEEIVEQGLHCGAFAEKVVVDLSQIAKIPADMPMDAASLLSCGVITGVGAVVNTADVRPGQNVVVIGHVHQRRDRAGVKADVVQGAVRAKLDHRAHRLQAHTRAARIVKPRIVLG
ncbi:MAG: alcohol dehydrogenase catalytic domain-containing protein, partial [Pseudomonadota bacterium]